MYDCMNCIFNVFLFNSHIQSKNSMSNLMSDEKRSFKIIEIFRLDWILFEYVPGHLILALYGDCFQSY